MASTDDLVNFDAPSNGDTSVDDLVNYGVVAQPQAVAPEQDNILKRIAKTAIAPVKTMMAGSMRGAADIGNTILGAEYGLENKIGLEGAPTPAQWLMRPQGDIAGLVQGEKPMSRAQEALQDYQTQYGSSIPATIGRIGTNVAMTAPLLAEGGAALNPLVGNTLNALRATRLGRAGVNLLTGAAQGAATAAATSGGYDQPVGEQIKSGALIGGAFGAAGPMIRQAGQASMRGASGVGMVNPLSADLARTAIDDYGIPVRGSQITNSKFIKNVDSLLGRMPFSGMAKSDETIAENFNKAALSTIGGKGSEFTPDVVSAAKRDIGAKFEKVAQNTTLNADTKFVDSLNSIKNEAAQVLPSSELQPILSQIDNISQSIDNGAISGKTYQALTRKGTPLDRAIDSADPNISYYASRVREALDDALERSAPQDMRDMLREARYQWKNYVTLKPLIEKSQDGRISPALLLNRVRQVFGDLDTGGGGDLGKLAKIGQQFLKPASTSNTAENIAIGAGLGQIPLAITAPAVGVPALLSTAGTIAGARGATGVLASDWYRNMLLNSMNPQSVNPLVSGAVRQSAIPLAVESQRALTTPLVVNSR